MSQEFIYEVADTTSDEVYYALGVFLSLKAAKDALMDVISAECQVCDYNGDCDTETLEIRERQVGWGDQYKTVLKVKRERGFTDDDTETWNTKITVIE